MTMLPMLMRLRVASPGRRGVRLWLPLFLLWPLVLLLLALPLLIAIVVDVSLWLAGHTYHHYSVLIVRTLGLLGETRGLVVHANDGETAIDLTVL